MRTDLEKIRAGVSELSLPGFDHARGDPEPAHHIYKRQPIVICEGLYLLHDKDGWEEIHDLFDISIYIDADLDQCMDRVKVRNKCIPGYTEEEIFARVDAVDRRNAQTVRASKDRADWVFHSVLTPPTS